MEINRDEVDIHLDDNVKGIWEKLCRAVKPLTPKRRDGIIRRLKLQKHKKGVDPNDWDKVHPNLLLVAEFDLSLCEELGLYVEYTSIIRPMIKGVSISDSHAQKRAYDRTLRGWKDGIAPWFVELINGGLKVGAVSRSDGKEREAVFEEDVIKDGKQIKWKHLHFQVRA
jgi:hypothetical protein